MSSGSGGPRDAVLEKCVPLLSKRLERSLRDFGPVLKATAEFGERIRPISESMGRVAAAAEPFVRAVEPCIQAVEPFLKRWDAAEDLIARGWVPNSTTPFGLVEECADDAVKLQRLLIAHYSDNWRDVRERLGASVSSRDIDDEAKAVFREALDAHEHGRYRCVVRLLFPEFERVFRQALFEGKAGQIKHGRLIEELTGGNEWIAVSDFLFAGIQDVALYNYLTGGARRPRASGDRSSGHASGHTSGLYITVDNYNLDHVRLNPVPTRHAVVHGLAVYSSQQSSLNAIFIADYVFAVTSAVSQKRSAALSQCVAA